MNLGGIVRDYIRKYRAGARRELLHYAKQPSLGAAVREAALCRLENGNRHSHQYRISGTTLEAAERALQRNAALLRKATSFEQLHRVVEQTIGAIRGIGPLTTYDIAHRIGAFLKLEPELVYLHAGTRDGARELGFRGKTIAVETLPPALRFLSAAELEDCLCIYAGALRSSVRQSRRQAEANCIRGRRERGPC